MDLEKLKKDHPDLYVQIVQIGVKDGVDQERMRTVTINGYRSKFPKLSAIFDEAIEKGHDMTELNLNIMSAQSVSEELDKTVKDTKDLDTGGDADDKIIPEMKDGVMSHPDHVDELSNKLAALPGM